MGNITAWVYCACIGKDLAEKNLVPIIFKPQLFA